jgi:bacillithiol biosynthesis deacetylase BshB1
VSAAADYGIDVLAFGPHPDDVEIFCGGTLIRLADRGYRVGVVDMTHGELASRGTPEIRAGEAAAAAQVLGVAWRGNLGLPDGGIDGGPGSPHLAVVVGALRAHRPEIVLVPWREERHPDHVAASALLKRATFLAGLRRFAGPAPAEPFVPRQVLHYEMRHRMVPSFVVDTTDAWTRKAAAIACHASQMAGRPGDVPTLIGSPLAIDAIEARDRYRGSQIGVRYGEALRTASVPGLVDPVAHFRANPFTAAHAFEAER